MLRFMFIRILQALPVIFVVITATFFLVRSAPGGPFDQEKVVIPEVKKGPRSAVPTRSAIARAIFCLPWRFGAGGSRPVFQISRP